MVFFRHPKKPAVLDRLALRQSMVETQIKRRHVTNEAVLNAFLKIPREDFVPEDLKKFACEDRPLHIGEEQTISQPYIVALMTSLLEIVPTDRILEVGTGSGYQTAILHELAKDVYSIEVRPSLHKGAAETLKRFGIPTENIKLADGNLGWPEKQPFDKIILTAAVKAAPPGLLEQLKDPGLMIYPCGAWEQILILLKKSRGKITEREITTVRFVNMVTTNEER
ncbi:MAG: protein-L-isoaspartate(D-aspartate) O-methyltransferase [Candidatus Omnitrophica bacterium]|nr:protein-L-isoaspartate(D-aspartate) O-methyltransferase [Candidatus Omnitrophota bacterium]